jgi:hypothetical protein
MNTFKVLPLDMVEYILSFSQTYYKENYKNRNGAFYKQIEESRKEALVNLYVPIKRRCLKERFSGTRTYFYERFLGGKYILYIRYDPQPVDSDMDDDDYEEDPERVYSTIFCRVSKYSNIMCGINRMEEHRFDLSTLTYGK